MKAMQGILVLNKPSGMTSHDCVNQVRRLLQIKKVGHTGTLDPEVKGVLPLCIGTATRVAEYLIDYDKEYVANITFGRATTTEDQTGETVEDQPLSSPPSIERIKQALAAFKGQIEQVPPMYSAIKVQGIPLYEYARRGQEIERKSRTVTIHEIELLTYHPETPYPSIKIRVNCSKGTYIRTLGVDIGKALHIPAHMSGLVRTQSGPFTLDQAISLDELKTWSPEEWDQSLLPTDTAVLHLPQIELNETLGLKLMNGQVVEVKNQLEPEQLYRVYMADRFIAIAERRSQHRLKPRKVFRGVEE